MIKLKYCNKCKTKKPITQFDWRSYRNTFSSECKLCRSAYHRELYKRNPIRRQQTKNSNKLMKRVVDEILFGYLLNHPCVDCGISDLRVLEFDHLRDKIKPIGEMHDVGADTLINEISKCEIRCANCHRVKTLERRNKISWRCS